MLKRRNESCCFLAKERNFEHCKYNKQLMKIYEKRKQFLPKSIPNLHINRNCCRTLKNVLSKIKDEDENDPTPSASSIFFVNMAVEYREIFSPGQDTSQ